VSLHPEATHWFETYVPRDQTVYALEALVATGAVELERDYVARPLVDTHRLHGILADAGHLVARYASELPQTPVPRHLVTDCPEQTAADTLACLRRWLAGRLRRQRHRRDVEQSRRRLGLLRECIAAMGDDAAVLDRLVRDKRFLLTRIHVCPGATASLPTGDSPGLMRDYAAGERSFRVAVLHPDRCGEYDEAAREAGCEAIELPGWLLDGWLRRDALLARRFEATGEALAKTRQALRQDRDAPALTRALEQLALLDWYLQQSVTLTEDRRHCHVTGWTTADEPGRLQQALDGAGIDARILFRPAPPGRRPPVSTGQGGPADAFRLFVRMLGAPGAEEFDPAPLLPVLVPLLFGFMFPDLGHGLVLAAAGLLLSRRFPALRFLVPCGIAAAAFGVLFGEVFGLHGLLPLNLVHPLDEPMTMLLASLVIGAAIILLGLAISGVEAHWRGELRRWLWQDGAVLVLYTSALVGLVFPPAWVLTGLASVWYLVGLRVVARGRFWSGVARLAFSALELAMNTLSFVRVGAFALAHAALSHALLEIAAMVDLPVLQAVVLVIGHALIIVVEGLVVFVQTTRLILFEFFSRFLLAEGRLFRPLSPPAAG